MLGRPKRGEMTTATAGTAVSRHQLGRHLTRFREGAGLTLREASRKLDIAQSQVSRVENGEAPIRGEDVDRACTVYGITDLDLRRALIELAKETRQPRANNWLSSYADVVSDNFALYVGLEAAASALAWYEPEFVPGLLQTPDYARHVMKLERFTGKQIEADKLNRRLEFRLRRQQVLTREPTAPMLSVVVGEVALRGFDGSPAVMAGQLEHLVAAAAWPNVEIQVMPLGREHGGQTTGQFIVLDFPPRGGLIEPSSVYVDGYLGFFLTDKADEAERYRNVWTNVRDTALTPADSLDVIGERIGELQRLGRAQR
jgi:transcriptional regulator with XRE-family HTH domain